MSSPLKLRKTLFSEWGLELEVEDDGTVWMNAGACYLVVYNLAKNCDHIWELIGN